MSPRAGASKVTMVRPGRRAQVEHACPCGGERLGDGADVLVGDVDHAPLERLVAVAVDLAGDHLGPAHLQLVALAAHRLDEHGELQLAPAGHLDDVGESVSSRRIDTLPSTSRSRRSRRWREVR
jgi:hypothetical protein